MTQAEEPIFCDKVGEWGVITLARPKALNSLTKEMCATLDAALIRWADDDEVKAVLIEGAGEKAFCAGGDIRWLYDAGQQDPAAAATFFRVEYLMNARIAAFPKPYVALMDGVTMGGGVGVSLSASHRIATDRTLWAMPECGIGLIPDVGGTYLLSRLPGGLGYYLGLTGRRLSGQDCLDAEIATHLVPAAEVAALREILLGLALGSEAKGAIDAALKAYRPGRPGPLIDQVRDIDTYFMQISSVAALVEKLRRVETDFAKKALTGLKSGSPTSLVLTHRLIKEAPEAINDCLMKEFCAAARLMAGPDFHEGVRAQIIDKDRRPQWSPGRLTDVEDEVIGAYLTPPADGPLDLSGV